MPEQVPHVALNVPRPVPPQLGQVCVAPNRVAPGAGAFAAAGAVAGVGLAMPMRASVSRRDDVRSASSLARISSRSFAARATAIALRVAHGR